MVTAKNVKDPRVMVSQKVYKKIKSMAKSQKTTMADVANSVLVSALF